MNNQPTRDALDRAVEADCQIWQSTAHGSIERRNRAVRAALDAGWSPDEVAARLKVRSGDIHRWISPAADPFRRPEPPGPG